MKHAIIFGKLVKKLANLRGGGSALPGYLVEKIDKDFLAKTLAQIRQGVILVTGTNGKTTTTKIISELLESKGLRVITNRTGSNFTRGIVSELISKVDHSGQLNYDVAVLELDEAHARHFISKYRPDHVVVLNVMRDQLDRFGEIDTTTSLLRKVVSASKKSVILNGDDPRIAALAKSVDPGVETLFFGSSKNLHKLFLSDDDLNSTQKTGEAKNSPDIKLESFEDQKVTYKFGGSKASAHLKLTGVYNFLNAAAALVCLYSFDKKGFDFSKTTKSLEKINPAFGRGESLDINGQKLDLVLVKNPSGFRLSLQSFDSTDHAVMIAINDQYADGRDMSWLWDVDFSSLKVCGVKQVSGIRGYDMALRLQYDDVEVGEVDIDLASALGEFIRNNQDRPKRIFCTYTAMLKLRSELGKYTDVEKVL